MVLGFRAWWAQDLRSSSAYLSETAAREQLEFANETYFARYLMAFIHSVLARVEQRRPAASRHSRLAETYRAWVESTYESVEALRVQFSIPDEFESSGEAKSWVGQFLEQVDRLPQPQQAVLAISLPPNYSRTNFRNMMELAETFEMPIVNLAGAFRLTTHDFGVVVVGRGYLPRRARMPIDLLESVSISTNESYAVTWDSANRVTAIVWSEGRIAGQYVKRAPDDVRGPDSLVRAVEELSTLMRLTAE